MAVLFRYNPQNLTAEKYDEVNRRLRDQWPPEGLEYHVAFGRDGEMKVSEIWSSAEQQEAWSAQLRPVLEEVGVELAGPPEQLEIHNQERF